MVPKYFGAHKCMLELFKADLFELLMKQQMKDNVCCLELIKIYWSVNIMLDGVL